MCYGIKLQNKMQEILLKLNEAKGNSLEEVKYKKQLRTIRNCSKNT